MVFLARLFCQAVDKDWSRGNLHRGGLCCPLALTRVPSFRRKKNKTVNLVSASCVFSDYELSHCVMFKNFQKLWKMPDANTWVSDSISSEEAVEMSDTFIKKSLPLCGFLIWRMKKFWVLIYEFQIIWRMKKFWVLCEKCWFQISRMDNSVDNAENSLCSVQTTAL